MTEKCKHSWLLLGRLLTPAAVCHHTMGTDEAHIQPVVAGAKHLLKAEPAAGFHCEHAAFEAAQLGFRWLDMGCMRPCVRLRTVISMLVGQGASLWKPSISSVTFSSCPWQSRVHDSEHIAHAGTETAWSFQKALRHKISCQHVMVPLGIFTNLQVLCRPEFYNCV